MSAARICAINDELRAAFRQKAAQRLHRHGQQHHLGPRKHITIRRHSDCFGQIHPRQIARVPPPLRPDYGLGNHVAPLGLAFSNGNALGDEFAHGAFVGLHGSWNRKPLNGYKVVFVPFHAGRPAGSPVEVLGAFLTKEGKARGRPVGVALHRNGLLVADDVGNVVWNVRRAPRP